MNRLMLILAAGLLSACGVVGAPVAPETIGVAPTMDRQKRQHEALEAKEREAKQREAKEREAAAAEEAEEQDPALLGQDENLPPLRPVGTR